MKFNEFKVFLTMRWIEHDFVDDNEGQGRSEGRVARLRGCEGPPRLGLTGGAGNAETFGELPGKGFVNTLARLNFNEIKTLSGKWQLVDLAMKCAG